MVWKYVERDIGQNGRCLSVSPASRSRNYVSFRSTFLSNMMWQNSSVLCSYSTSWNGNGTGKSPSPSCDTMAYLANAFSLSYISIVWHLLSWLSNIAFLDYPPHAYLEEAWRMYPPRFPSWKYLLILKKSFNVAVRLYADDNVGSTSLTS